MFFHYVFSENRPISDFVDARYTFLNQHLAKFFLWRGRREGPRFPQGRSGELPLSVAAYFTQGSVLAASSYPNRTSPTIRGKYILNNLLGAPPPPPPPDVPPSRPFEGQRCVPSQQLEAHRSDPVCASCHGKMDVLGLASRIMMPLVSGGPWMGVFDTIPVAPCRAASPSDRGRNACRAG